MGTFSYILGSSQIELLDSFFNENGWEIKIEGDNDFYSQRDKLNELNLPINSSSLEKLDAYMQVKASESDPIKKTGLGSSAALVTSLVGCILGHSNAYREKTNESIEIVHRLSQFAHCMAQGKIGSGFDVSSAIFGSNVYKRFSKCKLSLLLEGKAKFNGFKPQSIEFNVRK